MNTPKAEEDIKNAIIDSVNLFASKGNGSWEITQMPELSSLRVTYSRKLKFAPFTTYKVDKLIQYGASVMYNKNMIPEVQNTLDMMKHELDTQVLDQLTE